MAAGEAGPHFARWLNPLGLCLLIAAVLMLAAFHLLPAFESPHGWLVWEEVVDFFRFPSDPWGDPVSLIGILSFVSLCCWVVAAPFLSFVARRSRLTWWLMVLFSGLLAVGLCSVLVFGVRDSFEEIPWNPGSLCLFYAPVINLMGVLLIRRERQGEVISAE